MKVILLILDGWGFSPRKEGNALRNASLPTFEYLERFYPSGLLKASGISAGLPWGEAGNSEVGHLALGSGQVILHYMPRIIKAIQDGSFFKNNTFLAAIEHVKRHDSLLHLVGLLGSGSVHSYVEHLYALLELGASYRLSSKVRLHLFTDGKDSPPQEALALIASLKDRLSQTEQGEIATFIGRDYAMDRDFNWDKTRQAFNLLVKGEGTRVVDELKAIRDYYKKGLSDNALPPTVVLRSNGLPKGLISPSDSMIFFDYREDSARQLTKAFTLPQKVDFTPEVPQGILFVTFTQYDKSFPALVAFEPPEVIDTLADILASKTKPQLHVAETQKYAHVTYFFNGMQEERHAHEEWILVPSIDTTDPPTKPEMRTPEITQTILNAIDQKRFETVIANFANSDVIAHLGNFPATIKACESIDSNVGELVRAIENQQEYALFITADHGHVESMIDPLSGQPLTEHTANDVPFYLIHPQFKKERSSLTILSQREGGFEAGRSFILADVAPTILDLMGIPTSSKMTGKSMLSSLSLLPS